MRQIKVSDQVHEKLKGLSEKRGISINDLIEEMLNLYLGGFTSEKSIDKVVTKEFVSDYDRRCYKCGRDIRKGDTVTMVKFVYSDGSSKNIYYCFECANPNIAKLYKKKREIELVVKQLKQEADSLVNEIKQLETIRDFYKLKADVMQFWKTARDVLGSTADLSKVNEFFDRLLEIVDKVNRLEASLQAIHVHASGKSVKKREIEAYRY